MFLQNILSVIYLLNKVINYATNHTPDRCHNVTEQSVIRHYLREPQNLVPTSVTHNGSIMNIKTSKILTNNEAVVEGYSHNQNITCN